MEAVAEGFIYLFYYWFYSTHKVTNGKYKSIANEFSVAIGLWVIAIN